jgi:hypothetical protein
MESIVKFLNNSEHVNAEVQANSAHTISVIADTQGKNVVIECASRLALYELGRAFMDEALFGTGEIEFYPLIAEGKSLVVNGARLTEHSSRLFVHFPIEKLPDL